MNMSLPVTLTLAGLLLAIGISLLFEIPLIVALIVWCYLVLMGMGVACKCIGSHKALVVMSTVVTIGTVGTLFI